MHCVISVFSYQCNCKVDIVFSVFDRAEMNYLVNICNQQYLNKILDIYLFLRTCMARINVYGVWCINQSSKHVSGPPLPDYSLPSDTCMHTCTHTHTHTCPILCIHCLVYESCGLPKETARTGHQSPGCTQLPGLLGIVMAQPHRNQ